MRQLHEQINKRRLENNNGRVSTALTLPVFTRLEYSPPPAVIYSQLLRSSTARGSCTSHVTVGLAKV